MESYLNTLKNRAEELGISLLTAFKRAEVPTSTYYRTVNETTELRYDTARKVMEALETIHSIQQAIEHTRELRATNQRVNRRTIRAGIKPGSTGV